MEKVKKAAVVKSSSDQAMVASMYLRGFTGEEIADWCGISRETIIRYLKITAAQEVELMIGEPLKAIMFKLESLELLYRRAADPATEDSEPDQPLQNTATKSGPRAKNCSAREMQLKAMQGIERCIELRIKLLGLDAMQTPQTLSQKESDAHQEMIAIDVSMLSEDTIGELLRAADGNNKK